MIEFCFFCEKHYFCRLFGNIFRTMTADSKYDVFISYSRKDYVDENKKVIPGNIVSQIKDAFKENDITFWMDEEGIYSGDEFAKIIAKIIRQSRILLFISTKNSNASEWTSDEIATARMYKKKIIPFKYDDSFYNEEIIIFIAKLDFIDYLASPEQAINKLVSSVKKHLTELEEQKRHEEELLLKKKQEEEERRRKELEAEAERQRKLEEEKLKKQIKKEIKQLAIDHRLLSAQQEVIVQQLLEKNLAIGNEIKTCPVCKKQNPIGASYCEQCGFQFPPLYALDGAKDYPFDKDQLAIFTKAWNDRGTAQIEKLDRLLKELETELKQKKQELKEKKIENEELKETLDRLRNSMRVEEAQQKEPAKLPKNSQQHPEGALCGLFSVSPHETVYFSKGNLLFQKDTNLYRFSEVQHLTLVRKGDAPQNPQNWTDLFSQSSIDWGDHPIINGGNKPGLWRTPTKDEWDYLFFERSTDIRFVKATIGATNGIIIFPDKWDGYSPLQNINKTKADYSSNMISVAVWQKLFESKGAIFLPANGYIKENSPVLNKNHYGYYWAAPTSNSRDYYLYFYGRHLATHNFDPTISRSVRLIYSTTNNQ